MSLATERSFADILSRLSERIFRRQKLLDKKRMESPPTKYAVGDGDNTSSLAAKNDNDGPRNDQVKHETLEGMPSLS